MSNLIDGAISRRMCLQVGAIGISSLSLAEWVVAQSSGSVPARAGKSVIMVYLPGGPSHIDIFDMKPQAPAEIRGEFQPIRSNVPGLEVCELLPKLSQIADKYSIVRGFLMPGGHDAKEVTTGFKPQSNRPAFGSVISRLQEQAPQPLPPYITLIEETTLPFGQDPAYLGAAHKPFAFRGPDMANLSLPQGMPHDGLADRVALLNQFDQLNRAQDSRGEMAGMDAFTARALDRFLLSAKLWLNIAPSAQTERRGGEGLS